MSVIVNNSLLQIELRPKLGGAYDLNAADEWRVYYIKPDGTEGHWDAYTDGTNVLYQTQDGDLDQSGDWKVAAWVRFGTASARGAWARLKVDD